ncbi:MAG: MBL fold metallo-hydrolase [Vicinamibacterales bacterium]
MKLLLLALLASAALAAAPGAVAGTLDIYWIDVEGGASTFIVTPRGQSVLMDAGYAGLDDRDAVRIEHVVRDVAGLARIDYALTSHFHADHVGALAAVARHIPVGTFIDHGESVERDTPGGRDIWTTYLEVTGARRHVVVPGEHLTLAGVEFVIVASNGEVLKTPLAGGGPNGLCAAFTPHPPDAGENARSLGYLLRAGSFEFLDLGDLSWNLQGQLACPASMLGHVDLMQAPHHGVRDDVVPQMISAVAPSVVVMNNGPAKGAGAAGVEHVKQSPGLQDFWSLHRLIANDAMHNAPEMLTANLGETADCPGHWIRARVNGDGTFTVTNSRNQFAKTYRVK